ncbi:MAG: TraB/GumN family protein [Gammaproteobacteria bacterium]|nr:TraB/GumN family protein [Gammaproteobacteria bacterium]
MLFVSSLSYAASPVWKVSKGNSQLYVGGTVHVLGKSDYPLPAAFDIAYALSQILVFETDIQAMQSPELQQKVMANMLYSSGGGLKEVLSDATYQLLEQHLASRGVPIARMKNIKPGMVSMTLTVMELQRLGLAGTGVDEHFNARAVRDQKVLLSLETVDEQLAFIENLGLGQEDAFIRYTLRDINELPTIMQAIKKSWRRGDIDKMNVELLMPFKQDFPKVYNNLIVKRNKAWMPKLVEMMKSAEVEFVLVGALHLVGKDGVLAELETLGYKVEML